MRAVTETTEQAETETDHPIPESIPCPDCGKPSKSAQGLAGHRRLAHSTSTGRALDERDRELTEHQRTLESRSTGVSRREEAARRREDEAARRERSARKVEETPESERVRRIIDRQIASLPEVNSETLLRVKGTDYRVREDGRLEHLYWPNGAKTEFEEGQWFQFEGRAYCVSDGELRELRSSAILASVLDKGG